MRSSTRIREISDPTGQGDPRDGAGAEIIDLATRQVLPIVTQRKRGDGLGMVAGIAFVMALGAVTLWSMDAARTGPQVNRPAQGQANRGAMPAQTVTGFTPPPPAELPKPVQQRHDNLAAPSPQPVLAEMPGAQTAIGPQSNPFASPTVVFDASALPVPVGAGPGPGDAKGGGNGNEDFAARLGLAGNNSTATASAAFNPGTTVTQGTLIPAVLETAIDTDVPGYVRAVVSTDVRSFDGTRVLIPRSSRLIGQYKSGVQAGQKRAYVIWTRVIRPDGVSVDIASPAIAFGGETGLDGKVSSHFFERFGSAMLLSVIGGLSAFGGNAGVVIAGGGQSAAAAAVNQGASVGPTIRVRQGQPVRVFTAKDLDFSKVS